jgi:hypothetical protein
MLNELHKMSSLVTNYLMPEGEAYQNLDFESFYRWEGLISNPAEDIRIAVASDGIYGKLPGKVWIESHLSSLVSGIDIRDANFSEQLVRKAMEHPVFELSNDDITGWNWRWRNRLWQFCLRLCSRGREISA